MDAVLLPSPGIRLGNTFSTVSTATTTDEPPIPRKAAEFSGGAGAAVDGADLDKEGKTPVILFCCKLWCGCSMSDS